MRSLEDENEALRVQVKAFKTQAWASKSSSSDEKRVLTATSPTTSIASSSRQSSDFGRNGLLPFRSPRGAKWEADISVDDRGSVSFHGSTSAVHEPPSMDAIILASPQLPTSPKTQREEELAKQDLRQNAQQQRQLEDFAIANTAPRINLPKEVSEELLRFHWSWIHPLFVFVYRPAFTRGMTLVNSNVPDAPDPPYFSETLLKVITSHTARFLNHDIYAQHFQNPMTPAEFVHQLGYDARVGLAMETLNSSSIPMIQALLQQSAREVVFARSSQGWMYGGMAFRMAFDMGIHLPTDKLQTLVKSLSNEDIEVRKRLFWSCYSWDKVLSLYLGRMPAFTPSTEEMPLNFLDDDTETAPWQPYYGETPDAQAQALPHYQPTSGHVVSCFQELCRLCIIINDLMSSIYSAEGPTERSNDIRDRDEIPFIRISRSLHEFWIAMPAHLKVDVTRTPSLAPPIHIMSLNMLYHTIVILLHRPVVLSAAGIQLQNTMPSYQTCLTAAGTIHDLLILQATTFGLDQISYLNAYCAYMAATVSVLQFERELSPTEHHEHTSKRIGLSYLLDVIERSATKMPGLERSNAIIKKRMQGVIDTHLRAHTMLSPHSVIQQAAAVGPDTDQIALAQATAFQQISNQGMGHVYNPALTNILTPSVSPQAIPFTSGLSAGDQMALPAFVDDFLPAFPGQQFPVGNDYYFSSDSFDPQARMSLMGFNLDPHPRLDPAAINWNLMDGAQIPSSVSTSIPTPMSQDQMSGMPLKLEGTEYNMPTHIPLKLEGQDFGVQSRIKTDF